MASLIGPLASGIVGAASGTALIYERGTSADASVYSDKDGQTAVTAHALDSNGAVIRYVRSCVDVVVKNSAGTTVREFTWEDAAESVEVTNSGFNGTMVDGSTSAGGRISLDAVLSLLYTSLGAPDGKVLVNGAGQYLKDVVGSSASVFFNVKSSSYGATGDGTTDDVTAIQACINAAIAAGGGIVYVPPGTYIVSQGINISGKVTILGVSADVTVLKSKASTTSTTGILTITGAHVTVQGVGLENGTSASMWPMTVTGANARLIGCKMQASTTNFSSVSGSLTAIDCHFTGAAAGVRLFTVTSAGQVMVIGGAIAVSAAASTNQGLFFGDGVVGISGVYFTHSSSGACVVFQGGVGPAGTFRITNCAFAAPGVGGWTVASGGVDLAEAGCTMPAFSATFVLGSVAHNSLTRYSRTAGTSGAQTGYTPDANAARIHRLLAITGASMAIANPSGGATGMEIVIHYHNTSGGAKTPTFGTKYKMSAAPSVANGGAATFTFVYETVGDIWYQVGAAAVSYTI